VRVACSPLISKDFCGDGSIRVAAHRLVHKRLSHGVSLPYDVSETRAATDTGIASPGCATPSGFLSLLAFLSALIRTALFHAESVPGVEALRGFPLPVAATVFTARCPLADHSPREPHHSSALMNAVRRRPTMSRPARGLVHLGGPFASRRCYPTPTVDPLSAFLPSEDFSPRASTSLKEGLLSWALPRR